MLSLIQNYHAQEALVERKGHLVSQAEFLTHVNALAMALPANRHALIDCRDRYHFLVAFCAAMMRKSIALFPSTRAPGHVGDILAQHADTICLTDHDGEQFGLPTVPVALHCTASGLSIDNPMIDKEAIVAHAFTSGSTGTPNRTPKSWGSLTAGAAALERCGSAFDFDGLGIVATVPPGHSYGLETSIMPVLRSGAVVSSSHPLFPADIERALERVPSPKCLVTTPVHLKALVARAKNIPKIDLIMCATSPLPLDLAEAAEGKFSAPIFEIYGCTESGFVATRWPTSDPYWKLRDDLTLIEQNGVMTARAAYLNDSVPLSDDITMQGDRQFLLKGRSADQVNIAGKKASLAGLNKILMGIEGIEDGAFCMSDETNLGLERLLLFVVTDTLSGSDIIEKIRQVVDPVFVPRRVIVVPALPRNDVGKLPLEDLRELARQYTNRSD